MNLFLKMSHYIYECFLTICESRKIDVIKWCTFVESNSIYRRQLSEFSMSSVFCRYWSNEFAFGSALSPIALEVCIGLSKRLGCSNLEKERSKNALVVIAKILRILKFHLLSVGIG